MKYKPTRNELTALVSLTLFVIIFACTMAARASFIDGFSLAIWTALFALITFFAFGRNKAGSQASNIKSSENKTSYEDKSSSLNGIERPDSIDTPPTRLIDGQPILQHALIAFRAAGHRDTTNIAAYPTDIGCIAFWGNEAAYLFRTTAISTNADALQPFVELEIQQVTTFRLEFEIRDNQNNSLFRQQTERFSEPDQHVLIMPPARLPIEKLSRDDDWTLRISLNGTLLAVHRIMWRSDTVDQLEKHIDSDGEINESILPLLADNYAQPMSLDDLLDGKDDAAKQA
jgi:hypothetical protein